MGKKAITAVVGMSLMGFATPVAAHADGTGSGGDGWTPVTYTNRDYPAGSVCSFELTDDIVTQGVEERVASTYPDGTPLETDFRGPLTVRYTNMSTGATVDRDLSGTGQLYSLPDKSSVWVLQDGFGLTVHPGDPYHAAGLYVLSGPAVITVSPTHQPAIVYQTNVEDICQTLG